MTDSLDEYQQYLDGLGTWAQRASDRRSECHNLFEFVEKEIGSASKELRTLIEWRGSQMTEQDQKDAGGLLETGFFVGEEESFRAAAIVTCFEIERQRLMLELFRELERYRPEQDRAFSEAPDLKDEITKRKEMVSIANLRQDDRSSAFVYELDRSAQGAVVKLTSLVNPELVTFVKSHAPTDSSVEIRIDPDYPGANADPPFATYSPELPPDFLNLLVGVPFGQLMRTREWTVVLSDGKVAAPRVQADHFAGGYRALEMAGISGAERSELYFEELVDRSKVYIDHRDDTLKVQLGGPVIGRMIHCDTNAASETPCEGVLLYHLDLAINVYEGAKGAERLTTPLPKRVEAVGAYICSRQLHFPYVSCLGLPISFSAVTGSSPKLCMNFVMERSVM